MFSLKNKVPKAPVTPKPTIQLSTEKSQYLLGEQVKGSVSLFSFGEDDVVQLFVSLVCRESVKKTRIQSESYPYTLYGGGVYQTEYWDNADIYGASSVLLGPCRLYKDYSAKFPFTLNISPSTLETTYSINHYVKWFLFGVLQIRNNPDVLTPTYEIAVQRQSLNPVVTKEVNREIVLIPCKYCAALMPQTALFCTNCGAKRQA